MKDLNNLKDLVLQAFESKGILPEMRAQIRASVFKAMEEDNDFFNENVKNHSFKWENKKAMRIHKQKHLTLICKLLDNLMEFYKLDYSVNVFRHETNQNAFFDLNLFKEYGIDVEDKSRPYLFQLLERLEGKGPKASKVCSQDNLENTVFLKSKCKVEEVDFDE